MHWLRDFQNSCKSTETPNAFFYWAGLAAISATIRGKFHLDRFTHVLFPNVYVMLIIDSGMRKGIPIQYVQGVVTKVGNTRVVSGRNTIEYILKSLSEPMKLKNGKILNTASALLVSGEFSNFVHTNPQALTILTELYDTGYLSETGWVNSLKGSGQEKLKGVDLTLLGATNLTHFREMIEKRDIEGGFIARTFLIIEEHKNTLNSLVRKPTTLPDLSGASDYLKTLVKMKPGTFEWSDDGADLYDKWYIDYNNKKESRKLKDITGTRQRYEDHVLKMSMLISLSKRQTLVIEKEDVQEAIDESSRLLVSADKLAAAATSKDGTYLTQTAKLLMADILDMVKDDLQKWINRRAFLQKHHGIVMAADLDKILESFESSGMVTQQAINGEAHFQLTEGYIQALLEKAGK